MKKNNLLNIIKIFALTLVMGATIISCGNNNNKSNEKESTNNNDTSNQKSEDNTDIVMENPIGTVTPKTLLQNVDLKTLHDIKVTRDVKDFITEGKTEYKIVIPENPDNPKVEFAAKELQKFLFDATGATLEIINDKGLSYDGNSKYLSIGNTNLVNLANISVDKNVLTRSGYRILSKDNSVFLIGGGDFGTVFSVYEFLSHEIGYEAYSNVAIEYNESPTIKLHNFDITDVPDFQYTLAQTGWAYYDETARLRLRYNHEREIWMGPSNVSWHNTLNYLPKSTYYDAHPKWYSDDGRDLCFNAHGDEKEFKLFFDAFMKSFIDVINLNPSIDNITITQQDLNTWCHCDECQKEKEKYGTNAGTIVKFCNKVSDALKEYFKSIGSDRKINICFFAYQQTTAAPVTKDANGKYTPIDEDVVCRDNVYVFYAPITAEFLYSFDNEKNANFLDIMDKWCSISSHIYMWIYAINFYDTFTPYDTMAAMQNTYIIMKSRNVDYLYDQSMWNRNNSTDWNSLRVYLSSKLRWDVTADVDALTNKYMKFCYGDAADAMKEALNIYHSWFAHLRDDVKVGGSYLDSTLFTSTNFPKGFVDSMLRAFDKAYKAIEHLKDEDPGTYDYIKRRIALETLPYQYLNIEYYARNYTDEELLNLKNAFKADATYAGIMHCNESSNIDVLYRRWGIDS